MKIYDVSRLPSSIALGWDGENNWRPIAFDCSALLTGRSDAVVTLWLLPKGETQAFPVALERDGNTVVWTPLNEEMTAEHGQLQIVVQDGTDVGKSKVVDYTVHDSLVGGADHPAETPSWAVQVVEDVTEAAARYPYIGENGNWFVWDTTEGEFVDTGVSAGGGSGGSGAVTSVNGKTGAVTLSASDVGAYTKPASGIPASDLEAGVIPTVPQMATQANMSDWTSGKTVDAEVLKADFSSAALALDTLDVNKADKSEIPAKTSDLTNDSGFQTAAQVQATVNTAISNIPDELPAVNASDNGKVLGVVNGAWAVKSDEGGGSTITVDDAMSSSSTNPVQNKVVKAAFNERDRLMQKCQIVTEASENRWNKDAASTGLLGLDGRLYTGGSYDNYCYCNIGAVNEGDVITAYKKQSAAVDSASMARVVCYDSGGNAVVSAGMSTSTQSFTVPSGIASITICVTKNTGLTYNYMILVNAESAPTDYIPYVEHNVFYRATEDFLPKTSRLDKVNTLLGSDSPSAYAATLASGTTLTIDNAPYFIKKNVTVSARMEFETFTSVEVGKGQNSYRGKSVIVDGTNITQVSYNDSGTAVSGSVIAHGLTVSDYLQVAMFMGDDGKCEVTINTASGTFDTVFDFSAEWNYSPFVVGAQDMTDVQLGYSCSDIRCPMWVFGDSYLGLWDNRVGGQLRQLGFFNFALVGVAGGRANDGSKATYPDLQRMLALGTPKYIIWTLGMNGGDAANIAFLPALIALCEDKGIELILYKVPHIPTIDHSTLNAYIESTGLRYIDACSAVGATTAGVWYTGMLSSDEVHPSTLGAMAIAMRYLTDCPEIMQYGKSEEYAAELPAVTASDNGKFLRVVSGVWAAQAVPAAESNSFGGGS